MRGTTRARRYGAYMSVISLATEPGPLFHLIIEVSVYL